jgi:hypothetical protein
MTGQDLINQYRRLGDAAGFYADRTTEVVHERDSLIVQMFDQLKMSPQQIATAVQDRTADEISDLVLQHTAGETRD